MVYAKTSLGGYFFDATISEQHQFQSNITQNPVQTGVNVNDHIILQPIVITLQLFQSDCLASVNDGKLVPASTRSISAIATLYKLWYSRASMSLQTSLLTYKSMAIKSCMVSKDSTTQTAVKATVTLQQLIVTYAQSRSVSEVSGGAVNNGTVNTVTPSAAILAYREKLLNNGNNGN